MGNKLFPTINLSLEELINTSSLKKISDEDICFLFRLLNRINIHEVFRYQKFNNDFSNFLTAFNNGDYVVGKLGPCYEEFLYNLMNILNVSTNEKNEDVLTDKFIERVYLLGMIDSYDKLREEFPVIFQDLKDGRVFVNSLEKKYKKGLISKDYYDERLKYFYSCGLKRGFNNFIETQTNMYSRYIERRLEYKELIKDVSYGKTIRYHFDISKMVMLIIHKYLCICEDSENEKQIKFYLDLVNKYLNSSYDKSISISSDDISININTILIRTKNILRNLNHEGVVEWVLIPEVRDYTRLNNESTGSIKKHKLTEEEINTLKKKGQRKKKFYAGTDYLAKAIGLEKYQGYVAYIYPNGQVLLDTDYDEYRLDSAVGDAIYHIKAIDFERLSKLDKTKLKEEPSVKRIIHSKNWEDRAKEVIDYEGTKEEKEEALQLVKRLKNK